VLYKHRLDTTTAAGSYYELVQDGWSCILESDNMVTRLHIGDALTNRLDNTSTLMSQNDGESTFRVLSRQSVCVFAFLLAEGKLFLT
jgi:hypothetical protein